MTTSATQVKGRGKSQQKREAILSTAGHTFLDHGFDATTMDDIAKAANVSKQTVYSHFQSKEALFGAAIQHRLQLFELTEEFFDRDISCHALLLDLAIHLNDLLTSDDSVKMFRLCISTAPEHPKLTQLFYDNGPHHLRSMVGQYLVKQIEQGELKEIENVEFAATQFCHMVRADAHYARLYNLEAPTEKVTAQYLTDCVNVFMRAYGK